MHLLNNEPDYSPLKFAVMGTPGRTIEFVDIYSKLMRLSNRSRTALEDYFKETIPYPIEHFSVYNYGAQIESLGLIIHDKEDKEAPVYHAIELNKIWKNSTLVLTKWLGHKLRDFSVVEKVLEFFQK